MDPLKYLNAWFRRVWSIVATEPQTVESKSTSIRSDFLFTMRLVRTFWLSTQIIVVGPLLAIAFALSSVVITVDVMFTTLHAATIDALIGKSWGAFRTQIVLTFVYAGIFAFTLASRTIINSLVEYRWRRCLTEQYLTRWFGDERFARLEQLGAVENPDQRISEDVAFFPKRVINLYTLLIQSLGLLGSFAVVLWNRSPPLHITLLGTTFTMPGYLVVLAILFALMNTLVTHFVGRAFTRVSVLQERYEADFRSGLMRVREYAEPIALQKGTGVEVKTLGDRFRDVYRNLIRTSFVVFRLDVSTNVIQRLLGVIPTIIVAPTVISGNLSIGEMTKIVASFAMFSNALSLLAFAYGQIAITRATVQRLELFDRALHQPMPAEIARASSFGPRFAVEALCLNKPGEKPLLEITDVSFASGDRILVRGASGSGKSTLLRALAGLWPYGSGLVLLPKKASIAFIPQAPYLPEGDLATSLAYPEQVDTYTTAQYESVLKRVVLGSYCEDLRTVDAWSRRLSPGEKQRLAFARILLMKPDFVFLDEATSALDPALEQEVYSALVKDLPNMALVSVAHRPAVAAYHGRILEVVAQQGKVSRLVEMQTTRKLVDA